LASEAANGYDGIMVERSSVAAMKVQEARSASSSVERPVAIKPLQFSVRFLLLAMTVAAVALALLSWFGTSIISMVLAVALYFVVPVCLGTLTVYCRGYRQTFFAGTLAGATAPILIGLHVVNRGDVSSWLTWVVVQLFAASACGATAVATRRFLERRGWHLPPTSADRIPPE
jgi:hypothetical protein